MPYTEEQRKLFHSAAGDGEVASEHGMTQGEARTLAAEADKLKSEGKEKKSSFIDLRQAYAGY